MKAALDGVQGAFVAFAPELLQRVEARRRVLELRRCGVVDNQISCAHPVFEFGTLCRALFESLGKLLDVEGGSLQECCWNAQVKRAPES